MNQKQGLAAGSQLAPVRLGEKPIGELAIDAFACPGADALRAEETSLMVADDALPLPIPQEAHHLIGEPVLVDAVAEADQFVDIAHKLQRPHKTTRNANKKAYDHPPTPRP